MKKEENKNDIGKTIRRGRRKEEKRGKDKRKKNETFSKEKSEW